MILATIKDIARQTGLSLATISKYINGGNVREKNRTAIEETIKRLGFTVNELARGLKTNRSRSIGVLIPDLSNVFITTIITRAEDILRKSGYSVLVCDCHGDLEQEEKAIGFLLGKRVDGILHMPVSHKGSHLNPAFLQGVPVVLIDRMIHEVQDNVYAVLVNNIGGASAAVETLIDAGHHNIGIILGPQTVFTSKQRELGYTQAMIRHGLMPNSNHIIFSDYSVQGGYKSIRQLLQQKEITAVFVSNYEMTLGAIIAINEMGVKIPDELSFVGFDNQQLSQVVTPKLTMITQPLDKIGGEAAEILLNHLTQSQDAQHDRHVVMLPTGMICGDSVKHIGAKK